MKKVSVVACSIRRTWDTMNPVTRVVKSKKVYSRKNISWKKEIFD